MINQHLVHLPEKLFQGHLLICGQLMIDKL